MKIFIGTMEHGETDYTKCIEAIQAQVDVQFEHFIVSHKPEKEAHQTLYSKWNSVKSNFDLFLKVDADTVLSNKYVLKTFVELFSKNNRLTGVQAWLHDYMTDDKIYGLTCLRNNVIINDAPSLYCDRVDTGHDIVIRGDELPQHLNPAGLHCHYSSKKQAFHYGVHRAKKNQIEIQQKVQYAWEKNPKDVIRKFALIGFKLAKECVEFDYSSEQFEKLYERALKEYETVTNS